MAYEKNNLPPHEKPPRRFFVRYCALHISQWKPGMSAVVASESMRFSQYHWCEHHHGLSLNIWSICTRKAWLDARSKLKSQAKNNCDISLFGDNNQPKPTLPQPITAWQNIVVRIGSFFQFNKTKQVTNRL